MNSWGWECWSTDWCSQPQEHTGALKAFLVLPALAVQAHWLALPTSGMPISRLVLLATGTQGTEIASMIPGSPALTIRVQFGSDPWSHNWVFCHTTCVWQGQDCWDHGSDLFAPFIEVCWRPYSVINIIECKTVPEETYLVFTMCGFLFSFFPSGFSGCHSLKNQKSDCLPCFKTLQGCVPAYFIDPNLLLTCFLHYLAMTFSPCPHTILLVLVRYLTTTRDVISTIFFYVNVFPNSISSVEYSSLLLDSSSFLFPPTYFSVLLC